VIRMRLPAVFAAGDEETELGDLDLPLDLDRLAAGSGPWEVELGFGKGRYLLARARRQHLDNLLLVRGEALFLLAAVLPRAFASILHVYFPDPWPKSRHAKRRLFDPETVDLVLGILRSGGELHFATDSLDYGERVTEILRGFPGLTVERRGDLWPEGPRTNYEAKYVREGRPVLRLTARLAATDGELRLHPEGAAGILAATAGRRQRQPVA